MKKNLLIILLAGLMTLSFTACGKSLDIGSRFDSGKTSRLDMERVSFEEMVSDHSLLSGLPLKSKTEYAYYEELESEPLGLETLNSSGSFEYIDEESNYLVTNADNLLSVFYKTLFGSPAMITISESMTIDFSQYQLSSDEENESSGFLNGILIIPSGVTLTIENKADFGYISFERLYIAEGGKLILKDTALTCEKAVIVEDGGTVEMSHTRWDVGQLANYGMILLKEASGYENWMNINNANIPRMKEMPAFYNARSGVIDITSGYVQINCSSGRATYAEESFGLKGVDFGWEFVGYPWGMNSGKILTGADGTLEIKDSFSADGAPVYNKEPFVNNGMIDISTDMTDKSRGVMIEACHFQNYGTMNLNGSLEQKYIESPLVLTYNCFIENYGEINVQIPIGVAMNISGATVPNYFINYKSAAIHDNIQGENAAAFQVAYGEGTLYFNDVIPMQ